MSRYCDISKQTGECIDLFKTADISPVISSDDGPVFYVDLDNGDRVTVTLIEPYSTISQLSDVHRHLTSNWEHYKQWGF